MDDALLHRIADALERLAPPPVDNDDLGWGTAYRWDGRSIRLVERFQPADYDLLHGIDAQKTVLLENTRRHATGLPAHDVLLWGARGTGKSASVSAVVAQVRAEDIDLALVQCDASSIDTLPRLLDMLAREDRPFILFIDDLGFDEGAGGVTDGARALRSLLDGGASARPANVRLYVTSNRRHIVPRHLSEQDDPVNPRDVIDDKMALADRFGLSIGFHNIDQDAYVAIVAGYADAYGLTFEPANAIQWATQRGSRSGRVAWQYVQELAGRQGKMLPR